MAYLHDELFDSSLVKLKRALGITTCAMACTKPDDFIDYKAAVEYALWQVQENLCDVILDVEEDVEFNVDDMYYSRIEALHEAADLVERFNDSPVVVSPTGSFATVIANAIRQLATTREKDDEQS